VQTITEEVVVGLEIAPSVAAAAQQVDVRNSQLKFRVAKNNSTFLILIEHFVANDLWEWEEK